MQNLDSKTKAVGLLLLIVLALVVLQMTSLAPLPADMNSFLQGFAVGLGIVLVIAWIANRPGKSDS